jgi:alanyl-tRNA synthetase
MRGSRRIRAEFLEFFEGREHHVVASAPVIPHGDPTLLFTNAGMNQFKDVFLGTRQPEHTRVADTQKCIRVSGKHNDLEEVGRDSYHHTFFEMLGNWSFGDYFKAEAIEWAWSFLVDHVGLPPGRLWATVFGGDGDLGLPSDEEARGLWPEKTSLPSERVLRFGRKDNFWEMGPTGPCGPCSEVHIDLGPQACDNTAHAPDGSDCRVNGDCGRFIEIWNLVFIQHNHLASGKLEPLPARHVDTGMGFERLVALDAVLEPMERGEPFTFSNYNTDLFLPIFEHLSSICGVSYAPDMEPRLLTAFRVIADHVRALSIAMADGAMPDRKGRGSVLRSLLRRAARFGRQSLDIREPFVHLLAPRVADVFSDVFPEVGQRMEHITLVLRAEEESFNRTIDRGIERFTSLAASTDRTLDGHESYRLYHQDGFPRDLIDQMASEHGLRVDEEGWKKAEEEHRRASEGRPDQPRYDQKDLEGLPATTFVYPDEDASWNDMEARIVKLLGTEVLVLDRTPFYAESGGQVGDAGKIEADGFRFAVTDTVRSGALVLHFGHLEEGDLSSLPSTVTARVESRRRNEIAANHTATHLLHWALRRVLGDHATQQGSLVAPDHLRFDFTHPKAMTRGQIEEVERRVNRRIVRDVPLSIGWEELEEAKARGVTALFGEKYDENVRVVSIGDFSSELCGGTHCARTGQIGYFRIASESAVQVGVRRIIARTRRWAVEDALEDRRTLQRAARSLSIGPEDLVARVEAMRDQVKALKKKGAEAERLTISEKRREMIESFEDVGGVKVLVDVLEGADRKQLGDLADALRSGREPVAGVLVGTTGETVSVLAFATKSLAKKKRVDASKIVKAMAAVTGARGGGRPDFAQTGWKGRESLDEAVTAARDTLRAQLVGSDPYI